MAMGYGHVYVARVAFGAKDVQTVQAFLEAEAYPGPSLIIAYSHCIAHGYDMAFGRRAAEAGGGLAASGRSTASTRGAWPHGEPPLKLDSRPAQDPPSATTCATRPASAWWRSRIPSASSACSAAAEREAAPALRRLPAARAVTIPRDGAERRARPAG